MSKTNTMLVPALRQFRHNTGGNEFVPGFDYKFTNELVNTLEETIDSLSLVADCYFQLGEELGVPDGGSVIETVETLVLKNRYLQATIGLLEQKNLELMETIK